MKHSRDVKMCLHENLLYGNVFIFCEFYMIKVNFFHRLTQQNRNTTNEILPTVRECSQENNLFFSLEVCKSTHF